MSFMSDSHPTPVNTILVAATRQRHHALAVNDLRRLHDAQPISLTPFAHGPTPPGVHCKDAAAAYADDCFGESKIVRAGLARPMPDHDLASNLNSARAQVGMWVIPLSK